MCDLLDYMNVWFTWLCACVIYLTIWMCDLLDYMNVWFTCLYECVTYLTIWMCDLLVYMNVWLTWLLWMCDLLDYMNVWLTWLGGCMTYLTRWMCDLHVALMAPQEVAGRASLPSTSFDGPKQSTVNNKTMVTIMNNNEHNNTDNST